MAMTRWLWKETKVFKQDGSLNYQELTYFQKPADDPDNPDFEMREQQMSVTIDHTTAEATEGERGADSRPTAGDLTASQRTNVATGAAAAQAVLDRVRPLNPGP